MTSCRKRFPKKPIIVINKQPCKCQGLCLMKEFSKKNEDKCKTLQISAPSQKTKEFITGSFYEGDWSPQYGMHGHGVYTFHNGVVYEGEFKEGEMHGKGELRYETHIGQAIIRGEWKDGIMTEKKILFDDDTLEYDEHDWQYCKMPDRRYSREYAEGLQPGGRSYQTPFLPSKVIPQGYCDTIDGLYDRRRLSVYDASDVTKIIRCPSRPEQKWIRENCRNDLKKDKNMAMGPRPELYETFVEPTELLEPNLPPAVKYTEKSAIDEDRELEDTPNILKRHLKWGGLVYSNCFYNKVSSKYCVSNKALYFFSSIHKIIK